MTRDPFYNAILDALAREINPQTFEECAADLLRDEWPTLVPVTGGSDFGKDGAVGVSEGPPFPLTVTTGTDVIGNMTKSLKRYVDSEGEARRVIVATSQALTPRRRRNLESRAKELGFELSQVYDRDAIAQRLYGNSRWCLELLGLTGDPGALSAIPKSIRPLLDQTLVGRAAEEEWLLSDQRDLLIIGPPGSGKTFLANRLVTERDALFLVDTDQTRIAQALRDLKPRAVIVDDAHFQLDPLATLIQLRRSLNVDFQIVATSWPGYQHQCEEALGLTASQVRQLRLLTRDEMVEVVRGAGLPGPNALVAEIVTQAEGRPGLAVTMVQLVRQGDTQAVALGDSLSRSVKSWFVHSAGEKGTLLLACIALAGREGISLDAVRSDLGLSWVEAHEYISAFAHGGVLSKISEDPDDDTYVVHPSTLREVLVRDVLVNGPVAFSYVPLLDRVRNKRSAVRTLVRAYARGAKRQISTLRNLLLQIPDVEALETYAWQGSAEAEWVLTNFPSLTLQLAEPLLHRVPGDVLPILLGMAETDKRPPHQNPDHPSRVIEDWIKGVETGDAGLDRRQTLLAVVESWEPLNEDGEIASWAAILALSPEVELRQTDPGAGRTLTWFNGMLPTEIINGLAANSWPKVLTILDRANYPHWEMALELASDLAFPIGRSSGTADAGQLESMRAWAKRILEDVLAAVPDSQGIRLRARELADRVGNVGDIPIDDTTLLLYGRKDPKDEEDWIAFREEIAAKLNHLADRLVDEPTDAVIAELSALDLDVRRYMPRGPRRLPELMEHVATKVDDPCVWLRACLDQGAEYDLLAPFLIRAVQTTCSEWDSYWMMAFESERYRPSAVFVALTSESFPEVFLDLAIDVANRLPGLVENLCLRNQIPDATFKRLLTQTSPEVAGAAAIGEWESSKHLGRPVRYPIEWQAAIMAYPKADHDLARILAKDPDLATKWLIRHARELSPTFYVSLEEYDPFVSVLASLNTEQRISILEEIPLENYFNWEYVAAVIGDDLVAYARLLDDERLKEYHLAPLQGMPKEGWIEKGLLAAAHGTRSEEAVAAVQNVSGSFTGGLSFWFRDWIKAFEPLESHPNPWIRAVAIQVCQSAREAMTSALDKERREAVYGSI